jgi:hypothetical protein
VRGEVANGEAGTACSLRLYTETGRMVGERAVPPRFRTSFSVAPGDHRYYVDISCVGRPGLFRSGTQKVGGERKALDLGVIVLR